MTTHSEMPIACDPLAIPPAQRGLHAQVARRLFDGAVAQRTADRAGLRLTLDAGAFDDVAAWVTWERLCCPFLRFAIDVSPAGGALELTLTGPAGTIEFLEAELGLVTSEA